MFRMTRTPVALTRPFAFSGPFAFTALLLGMVLPLALGCGGGSGEPAAEVKSPVNAVESRLSPTATFQPAKEGDKLLVGGAVKTGENSEARLVFTQKGEVTIKPESFFEVGSGETLGKQPGGTAIYRIQKQNGDLKVETPQGVTAVLGTVFLLKVGPDGTTTIVVDEGKVAFTNQHGSRAEINPGEQLVAKGEGQLAAPAKIDPITREQWFKGGAAPALNQR